MKILSSVPLAIEQARSVLKDGVQVQEFPSFYNSQYRKLMSHKPLRSAWDYEKNVTIITMLDLAWQRIEEDIDPSNLLILLSSLGAGTKPFKLLRPPQILTSHTISKAISDITQLHDSEQTRWLTAFLKGF